MLYMLQINSFDYQVVLGVYDNVDLAKLYGLAAALAGLHGEEVVITEITLNATPTQADHKVVWCKKCGTPKHKKSKR